MTDELKHCPFCGGEAIICANGETSSSIECASCGASVPFYPRLPKNFGKHKDVQAISAWNIRSLSPLEKDMRNELEDAKEELIRAFQGDIKHTLDTAKRIDNLLRRIHKDNER